jgi:hypothetical protein
VVAVVAVIVAAAAVVDLAVAEDAKLRPFLLEKYSPVEQFA